MDEATEAKLAAIAATHPDRDFAAADGPLGPIILGAPTREQYLQYRILQRSESVLENAKAMDELLVMCAVDPDGPGIRAQLKRKPGMASHADVTPRAGRGLRDHHKKIGAARARFAEDREYAAQCWAALYRGEVSPESQAAGEQWADAVAYFIKWGNRFPGTKPRRR